MNNKQIVLGLCSLVLFGCGQKTPKDGLLGELPVVVKQTYDKEMLLKADFEKASKSSDSEEAEKILARGFNLQTILKEKIETIGKGLIGKEIPVEMAANITIKMDSALVIKEVKSSGNVFCEGQASLTDMASMVDDKPGVKLVRLAAVFVDKDGKALGTSSCHINFSEGYKEVYEKGSVGKLRMSISVEDWNAEQLAQLNHVVITQTDRDDYIKAKNLEEEIKNAFKAKENN